MLRVINVLGDQDSVEYGLWRHDVTQDFNVSALDALVVINHFARIPPTAESELIVSDMLSNQAIAQFDPLEHTDPPSELLQSQQAKHQWWAPSNDTAGLEIEAVDLTSSEDATTAVDLAIDSLVGSLV